MTSTVRISPLGPLLFRDGRPFSAASDETRAVSLLVPPPSTVSGFIRTVVGRASGWDWADPEMVRRAERLEVGAYAFARTLGDGTEQVVVPAPADRVVHRDDTERLAVMRLRPVALERSEGTDLPPGLEFPLAITADVKPAEGFGWIPFDQLDSWLRGEDEVPAPVAPPAVDERTHVSVDSGTRTAKQGELFVVEYRSWDSVGDDGGLETWRLYARVGDPLTAVTGRQHGHFGGERRPAVLEVVARSPLPEPSPSLLDALTAGTRIVMTLLTPAAFAGGWRPGWTAGATPGPWEPLRRAGARLVSAAVPRPQTVSGWSYDAARRGPKAGVRLAPAGSSYYFELDRPLDAAAVGKLWLTAVSDTDRHRRDGFGVAVWGIWEQA